MKRVTIVPIITLLFAASCSKTGIENQAGSASNSTPTVEHKSTASTGNSKAGIGSAIHAYYDSTLLTILFVEFSPTAEANLIAHNGSINFIYRSDPGLPNNQPFISVIDAIPGDGFNPVWREVQLKFNPGF